MRKYGVLFTVLLALLLLAGCASTAETASDSPALSDPASAARAINRENAEDYGICGENLVWYYKDHILVIRGQGPMDDYFALDHHHVYYAAPPWSDAEVEEPQPKIQWVFVEDGVTSIGANAFSNPVISDVFSQLSKVVLPDSVTSIGTGAFEDCTALTSINLPANLEKIGRDAFYGCENLPELKVPENVQMEEQNNPQVVRTAAAEE